MPGQTSEHPKQLAVEWGGRQSGHPSTYGLLGGLPSSTFLSTLDPEVGQVHDHLGGSGAPALFGLPDYSLRAIKLTGPLTVTVAAEHSHSSSEMVFRWLTEFLLWGFELGGWPASNQEVWENWDSARRRVNVG